MLLTRNGMSGLSSTLRAKTAGTHEQDDPNHGSNIGSLVNQLEEALTFIRDVASDLEHRRRSNPSELAIIQGLCRLLGVMRTQYSPDTLPNYYSKKIALTHRQQDVVRLLAVGLTRGEIADILGIKLSTVQSTIAKAMERTDTHSEISLVNAARMLGAI